MPTFENGAEHFSEQDSARDWRALIFSSASAMKRGEKGERRDEEEVRNFLEETTLGIVERKAIRGEAVCERARAGRGDCRIDQF